MALVVRGGCVAVASACVRVDGMRDGLTRCAVACEAPAGRGNPVGFGAIAYNVLQIADVGELER